MLAERAEAGSALGLEASLDRRGSACSPAWLLPKAAQEAGVDLGAHLPFPSSLPSCGPSTVDFSSVLCPSRTTKPQPGLKAWMRQSLQTVGVLFCEWVCNQACGLRDVFTWGQM